MIGTAYILRVPGSLSTSEYPVTSDGLLTNYAVDTVLNARFTAELNQIFIVKEFDGWMDCNMVQFIKDKDTVGTWWIIGAEVSSIANGAIEYTLSYNAPTSLLRSGTEYKGYWQSAPEQLNPNLRVVPTDGMAVPQRFVGFPTMSNGLAWVTFTTTRTMNSHYGASGATITRGESTKSFGDGPAKVITQNKSGYNVYGFPIFLDQLRNPSTATHVMVEYYDDNGTAIRHFAPTLWDIMAPIESLIGFLVSDIVDVSISYSCPYAYDIETKDIIDPQTKRASCALLLYIDPNGKKKSDSSADWYTNTVPWATPQNHQTETVAAFFELLGYTGGDLGDYMAWLEGIIPTETSYDDMEVQIDNRFEQSVIMRDYQGVLFQELPLDMFDEVMESTSTETAGEGEELPDTVTTSAYDDNGILTTTTTKVKEGVVSKVDGVYHYTLVTTTTRTSYMLPVSMHVHTDYDGMFRHMILGKNGHVMQYTMQEPKLPQLANAWQEYKARSLSNDRNAVIANVAMTAGTVALGIATGGMGFAVGAAASAGIQALQASQMENPSTFNNINQYNADASRKQQNIGYANSIAGAGMGAIGSAYSQHMKEKSIKNQPTQAVNLGHGLNELIIGAEFMPGFVILYPEGTEKSLEAYLAWYGYKVNTEATLTLNEGYYQGVMYPDQTAFDSIKGLKFDTLNSVLMEGIRIKVLPFNGEYTTKPSSGVIVS